MMPYNPGPVLFILGPITVFSYALFTVLGSFIAIYTAAMHGYIHKINRHQVYMQGLSVLAGGIIGAKLHYVIQYGTFSWDGFINSGFVFYGGFIGATLGVLIVSYVQRIPILKSLDLFGIGVPLGHGISRIGCFFQGCCYGAETSLNLPWLVEYLGAVRHPTQLYSVFGNLLIFAMIKYTSIKKKGLPPGTFAGMYLVLYPIMRFSVEFLRVEPKVFLGLTSAQVISIALFIIGSILLYRSYNLNKLNVR
jgi:phosphatidylglycerol---prolipoprotein diacylglyceryl transferase